MIRVRRARLASQLGFVAQFLGLPLHGGDYALIVMVSVLGSAATAGLTGATVMLTLTLTTLGLPLEGGAGLLLAIYPILDLGRTAVNVAGRMLVPVIVAKCEGLLTSPADAPPELALGWQQRCVAIGCGPSAPIPACPASCQRSLDNGLLDTESDSPASLSSFDCLTKAPQSQPKRQRTLADFHKATPR
ncbi:hypothetical protein AVT10_12815 [Sphingomonas hankookensis]|jgi:hypothetical protein|uniref:Sodium:dicarboxylate symporter n=1 Tax=Sphingomonas hankookensis TaxID=563996 RepID=A0ABR5YF01_9SPHN|nr:hypothetical protein AVT10_12815 [Sphingomonas hankookensis]